MPRLVKGAGGTPITGAQIELGKENPFYETHSTTGIWLK